MENTQYSVPEIIIIFTCVLASLFSIVFILYASFLGPNFQFPPKVTNENVLSTQVSNDTTNAKEIKTRKTLNNLSVLMNSDGILFSRTLQYKDFFFAYSPAISPTKGTFLPGGPGDFTLYPSQISNVVFFQFHFSETVFAGNSLASVWKSNIILSIDPLLGTFLNNLPFVGVFQFMNGSDLVQANISWISNRFVIDVPNYFPLKATVTIINDQVFVLSKNKDSMDIL